jgi:hypothetical protein
VLSLLEDELRKHHADNFVRLAVHHGGLSDDVGAAVVAGAPECVADDDDLMAWHQKYGADKFKL